MNVGDYVRTKDYNGFPGGIAQIKKIQNDKKHKMDWLTLDTTLDHVSFLTQSTKVVKSSPNIIDLIKKKDIVVDYNDNIYQVVKVWKGYVFTDKKNKFGQVITLVDYQIKSIVTCEQFSQMEYKVGE